MKLYHYWRSSCSWRVRWALAEKGLLDTCDLIAVDLLKNEQRSDDHLARNPMGLVPAFDTGEGLLGESLAICEWIEEKHPKPALLPQSAFDRARVRELVQMIAADTQPLQNLGVQKHHSNDQAEQIKWSQHWIAKGLDAYEARLKSTAGKFSFGDSLSLSDLCLGPQVYNAVRWEVDLNAFPKIAAIQEQFENSASYQASHPDRFRPA